MLSIRTVFFCQVVMFLVYPLAESRRASRSFISQHGRLFSQKHTMVAFDQFLYDKIKIVFSHKNQYFSISIIFHRLCSHGSSSIMFPRRIIIHHLLRRNTLSHLFDPSFLDSPQGRENFSRCAAPHEEMRIRRFHVLVWSRPFQYIHFCNHSYCGTYDRVLTQRSHAVISSREMCKKISLFVPRRNLSISISHVFFIQILFFSIFKVLFPHINNSNHSILFKKEQKRNKQNVEKNRIQSRVIWNCFY